MPKLHVCRALTVACWKKGDIEVHVAGVIVPGGEGIGDVGKGIVEVTEGSFNGNRFPRRIRSRRRGRMGGVP